MCNDTQSKRSGGTFMETRRSKELKRLNRGYDVKIPDWYTLQDP
jgi:hypothetical protein